MSNLIGQTLGRYHITDQLGEGGMATVYKAFDTRLESDVAVKVIRTERLAPEILEKSLKRFEREAKSLAKLTHPNIVKVTDYGEHEGKPYLVMSYLPGGTLKERLKGGAIPWQDAVQLILPIANALEYAHEHNLIHRDVKPSNILLTDKGQPMLTDFGVAKLFDVDETAELTGTGMGIGTPEYMAPEQWTGHVTPQTDIYALGVVFYEMVTGRKPYQADTPAALLLKQANDPLPRPRSFVSGLPEAVEKVLFKALAKGMQNRYPGMGEMVKAMEGLLAGKQVAEARPERSVKEETLTAVEFEPDEITQVDEKSVVREKSTRRGWVWGVGVISLLLATILLLPKIQPLNIVPSITPTNSPIPFITSTGLPSETPTPTQIPASETPTISSVSDEITDSKNVTMRLVPAGEFTMGSDTGSDDEKPEHQVYLDAFYMDVYEVTNGLYAECVLVGGCYPPKGGVWSETRNLYYGNEKYKDYPVVNVTWQQAWGYCAWREARLPTEAEWEKAARGDDKRMFPWGDSRDNTYANYNLGDTTKVGSYEKGISSYGIYDLMGNVWEWVNDYYSETYYSESVFSNPFGPANGVFHVIRGGSWDSHDSLGYTWIRSSRAPLYGYPSVGFRCVHPIE